MEQKGNTYQAFINAKKKREGKKGQNADKDF